MSFVAKNLLTVSPSSFAPDDLPNLSHWFSSDEGLIKINANNFTDETRTIELAGFPTLIAYNSNNPNGTYIVNGTQNGKNFYVHVNQNFIQSNGRYPREIFWDSVNSRWTLYYQTESDDSGENYESVEKYGVGNTDYPWQATWTDGTVSPTATTFDVPPTLQGDLIETWRNKANGPDATQLTTARKPSLTFLTKSGTIYPAVLFGGSQVLEISNSVTQNPPLTYYFVTVDTGGGASKSFVCQSTSTISIRNSFQTSTAGNLALRQSTLQNSSISTGGSSVLFAILNGGGTGSVGKRVSGITSRQTLTGLGTTLANSLSTLIGAHTTGGTNGIFGDFVEILIYKSAHTTTEQNQIIEYFKKRYPYIT